MPAGGAADRADHERRQPDAVLRRSAPRGARWPSGVTVRDGAWDIDDVADAPGPGGRRLIAAPESPPLSELAGYFMKVSQNFYGEMLLKALGRQAFGAGFGRAGPPGRARDADGLGRAGGRVRACTTARACRATTTSPPSAIVAILTHVWKDERLRGPFVASLPVGGHDGTLEARMRGTPLDGRVHAKTGTIANVRALSGYLQTEAGGWLVFSVIVNHHTAPAGEVDLAVDKALARLASARF